MSWGRVIIGGYRMASKASNKAADSIAISAVRRSVKLSGIARRSGVLGPGDRPPASWSANLLDFRGVATPRELEAFSSGLVPLGRAVDPQRGPAQEFWLGWDQLVRHSVIIGPAGSGKTRSVLVPWAVWAVRAGIGVVLVDVKGDLLDEVGAYTAATPNGRLKVELYRWDIADPTKSRPWNFLHEVVDSQTLSGTVTALLGEVNPADPNRSFAERDQRWLRGLIPLLKAVHSDPTPADLFHLVVNKRRLNASLAAAPLAGVECQDMAGIPDDEYSKATAFLTNRLSWLSDPTLQKMTSTSSFLMRDLVERPGLAVIGARLSHGEPAAAAASLALNMLRMQALGRFQNPVPMLWVLDEASVVANRVNVSQLLSVARGAGIGVVLGLQDVTQLGDKDSRTSQLASCHTVVAMRGCSAETAEFVSGRLGIHTVATTSMQPDVHGRFLPSIGQDQRPVLGSRELMHPPGGPYTATVHMPSCSSKPFLVDFS